MAMEPREITDRLALSSLFSPGSWHQDWTRLQEGRRRRKRSAGNTGQTKKAATSTRRVMQIPKVRRWLASSVVGSWWMVEKKHIFWLFVSQPRINERRLLVLYIYIYKHIQKCDKFHQNWRPRVHRLDKLRMIKRLNTWFGLQLVKLRIRIQQQVGKQIWFGTCVLCWSVSTSVWRVSFCSSHCCVQVALPLCAHQSLHCWG